MRVGEPQPTTVHLAGDVASARRAVAAIRRAGRGPIVVVLRGTNNTALDNANRATVELMRRQSSLPLSVVSVEYPATFPPWPDSVGRGRAALRELLDELRGRTDGRPVYLLAESQGAWVARDVLADPRYAQLVTRLASFADPAVAGLSDGIEHAVLGVKAVAPGPPRLSIRHVDDAVTATPPDLGLLLHPRFLTMAWTLLTQQRFSYDPHDYRGDAPVAARFLLAGERPPGTATTHRHDDHAPA